MSETTPGLAADNAASAQTLRAELDAATRYFMVTPPHNASRIADCAAAAGQRFQEIYGEAPQAWEITADWDARLPFLACAAPRALLDALRIAEAGRSDGLTTITPRFVADWNAYRAPRQTLAGTFWFATLHDAVLTIAIAENRRLRALRTLAVPTEATSDAGWLAQQLTREALRLDLAAPQGLVVCGNFEVPPVWRLSNDAAPRWVRTPFSSKRTTTGAALRPLHIDFTPTSLRRELGAWRSAAPLVRLTAVGALCLCIAASIVAVNLADHHRAAAAELQALNHKRPPPLPLPATLKPQGGNAPLMPTQIAAVNDATDRLNLPWRALFDGIETATPPQIALLTLEADARSHRLQGVAETRDSDAMFAYLAALRAQPALTRVLLRHHAPNTQAPNRPLRFEFEAKWATDTANSDEGPLPGESILEPFSTAHPTENKQ